MSRVLYASVCVYAKAKLKPDEKLAIQDSNLFTCGSCLFSPDSPFFSVICVRENLSCGDPIELSYFSATLVHFPPVCYWCGLSEETLVRDQELAQTWHETIKHMQFACSASKKASSHSQGIL